jgi:hypothetical protein
MRIECHLVVISYLVGIILIITRANSSGSDRPNYLLNKLLLYRSKQQLAPLCDIVKWHKSLFGRQNPTQIKT